MIEKNFGRSWFLKEFLKMNLVLGLILLMMKEFEIEENPKCKSET